MNLEIYVVGDNTRQRRAFLCSIPTRAKKTFNESQWIKLVFLLADTQSCIDDMNMNLFSSIPISHQKKYFRNTYYLTITALAHIIERHYYKINRHPCAGKFHVSLPCLLELIRDASAITPTPMQGCLNMQRLLKTDSMIGYDKNGKEENRITVITDSGGKIITAFPGVLQQNGED